MTQLQQKMHDLVKSLYKNEDGSPILLSPKQCDIFATIATRQKNTESNGRSVGRHHCMTHTRFGKSLTTGLAVLTRAATYPEKWVIIGGTTKKAQIIMSYINAHIFDNEYTAAKFRMDKGDSAESIRRHRNKNHITFNLENGLMSEVFICTAKEALGFGSANVVEDESALIPDNEHALVMRMLGDHPDDNFLFKIGNPFTRGHFLKSFVDPEYNKLVVTAEDAIHEGRINRETIEEASKFSFFDVLYKCEFPPAEAVDDSGWMHLFNEKHIQTAQERKQEPHGKKRLGVDVARGGRNFNVWTLRGDNYAKRLLKNNDNDLMSVVGTTVDFMKEHNISADDVFVDDVGVGGGVTDRLLELGHDINPVKEGESAEEEDMANVRAQMYAGKEGLFNWILRTGALLEGDWTQALDIRFKKDSSSRTRIEPKEDMRKRGVESPDDIDSLAVTFAPRRKKKKFKGVDPKSILEQGSKLRYL